jgi:Xaa-Pro aminopeptidase
MNIDNQRIERLKLGLEEANLDAMILRLPENIVMSSGVWPMSGFSYAVVTAKDGPAALIAPSSEDEEMDDCWSHDTRFFTWPRLNMPDPLEVIRQEIQDIAEKHKLTNARIGYEGSFEAVAPSHNAGESMVACESSIAYLKSILPAAKWSDATNLLNALRATKTDMETARLRTCHKVAGFGLEKFMEAVRPGISEAELAALVYTECLTKGVELDGVKHINVYPQISSGPNSYRAWRPIVTTGKRRLNDGELALLELAVCVDGFWADVTRVKVAGKPSAVQKKAFAAVKAAQAAAIECIKPGVKASTPDIIAKKVLIDAGFEKNIVHLSGHGLGFSYHEPEPFLIEGNDMILKPGHVFSVEPGLYDSEWGGIRLEDNVIVTANGAEVLTKAAKKL